MPPNDFNVELKLLLTLDKAAQDRVKRGVSTVAQELDKKSRKEVGIEVNARKTQRAVSELKKVQNVLKDVEGQADKTISKVERLTTALTKLSAAERRTRSLKGTEGTTPAPTIVQNVQSSQGAQIAGAALTVSALGRTNRVLDEAMRQRSDTAPSLNLDTSGTTDEVKKLQAALEEVGHQTAQIAKEMEVALEGAGHQARQTAEELKAATERDEVVRESAAATEALKKEAEQVKETTRKYVDLNELEGKGWYDPNMTEDKYLDSIIAKQGTPPPQVVEEAGQVAKGYRPSTAIEIIQENERIERELDAIGDIYHEMEERGKKALALWEQINGDLIAMGWEIEPAAREAARVTEERLAGNEVPLQTPEEARPRLEAEKQAQKERIEAMRAGAKASEVYGQRAVQAEKDVQKQISKTVQLLRLEAQQQTRRAEVAMRAAARLESFGRTTGIAGSALTVGIFAEANRYAASAKKPTEATEAWTRATNQLAQARVRVDEVILRQTLPLMNQIAAIATKTAGWVERNPQIVQQALAAGGIMVGVGGLASVIGRGLRVYADIKYAAAVALSNRAAEIHLQASKNELAAAGIKAKDIDGPLPGPGGLTGKLAGAGLLTASGGATLLGGTLAVTLGGIIGAGVNDAITKATGKGAYTNQFATVGAYNAGNNIFGPIAQMFNKGMDTKEIERKSTVFAAIIGRLTGAIDENSPLWERAADSVKKTGSALEEGINKLEGSANEQAIVAAFTKWKEDDARLVKEAAAERVKIIAESERAIATITRQYADRRIEINRQANEARTSITLAYRDEVRQAEVDYQQSREEIIREGGEALVQMEADLQERLRRMRDDHNVRMDELARAGDALGLVKEERAFNRERAEAEREVNLETAQRRKDLAQRLQDLATQYAQERTRRQEEYQQQLKENETRRAEELKRAAEQQAAELAQERDARRQKLIELQEGLNAERIRRREMFIAEIKDLDASLLGERNKKIQYYNLMLKDAEAWLAQYRAALKNGLSSATAGATAATRDTGGYMTKGMYAIAQNGLKEFVMSNQTTRAAERLIGSNLTQGNILSAMNGGSRQMVYNDMRRMEVPLSKDQNEMYKRGAKDALTELMGVDNGR